MACSSCGGGVTNAGLKGAQITNGVGNTPAQGNVKVINSAPMPVAAPPRRTV